MTSTCEYCGGEIATDDARGFFWVHTGGWMDDDHEPEVPFGA